MKISELIKELESFQERVGDVEVVMQGTLLKDGFSASNSKLMPDVFESTVETIVSKTGGSIGDRVRLFWQM